MQVKDEIIASLTTTISSKGLESAQLAVKLTMIKNQLLDSGVFD